MEKRGESTIRKKVPALLLALLLLVCALPLSASAEPVEFPFDDFTIVTPTITAYHTTKDLRYEDRTVVATTMPTAINLYGALLFMHPDDPSEFFYVNIMMKNYDTNEYWGRAMVNKADPSHIFPGQTLPNGTYKLVAFELGGDNSSRTIFGLNRTTGQIETPLPDKFADLAITLALPEDNTAPTATALSLPAGYSGTSPDSDLMLTLEASDTNGIGAVCVTFTHNDQPGLSVPVNVSTMWDYFAGSYSTVSQRVNSTKWANGTYSVSKIEVYDQAGNLALYEGASLSQVAGASDIQLNVTGCADNVFQPGTDPAAAAAVITNAPEGSLITVQVQQGGSMVLDQQIFDALAQKPGVEVQAALPNGFIWSFTGGAAIADASSLDLNIQKGKAADFDHLIESSSANVLIFANNGAMSVATKVFVPAVAGFGNQYINLYYYDETTGELKLEQSDIPLDETLRGYWVPITHNSTFVLSPNQLKTNTPPQAEEGPTPQAGSPQTSDNASPFAWLALSLLALGSLAAASALRRKTSPAK